MTDTPTPAQIEAAKFYYESVTGREASREAIERALTAATEVGPTYTKDGFIPSVKNPGQPMTNEEYQDIATKQRAAEVGEPDIQFAKYGPTGMEDIEAATIERCAQRLDALAKVTTMDVAKTAFEEAAAIIRALKDK